MKKNWRNFLAAGLVLALLLSSLPLSAGASEWSDNPVVLLPGYSSSALEKVNADGTTEQVWGVDTDAILQAALSRIAQLAVGLGLAASGSDPAYLAKIVGEESYAILDGVRCAPDGSSVYDVHTVYSEPETTNNAYYLAHPDESWAMYESDIMGDLGELVDPGMLFNFNVDFRMGAIDCAEQLHVYIQKVLAYTGKEKVNLLAISHGGQVAGTYLSLHGTEGLLVASKIADSVGITRSVIVNALRKFESAGLIETKSLGMKGTYIRIKNEFLFDELNKHR